MNWGPPLLKRSWYCRWAPVHRVSPQRDFLYLIKDWRSIEFQEGKKDGSLLLLMPLLWIMSSIQYYGCEVIKKSTNLSRWWALLSAFTPPVFNERCPASLRTRYQTGFAFTSARLFCSSLFIVLFPSCSPPSSQHCLKSCMCVACPVHPSASLNIPGPSLPSALLASGSAEDVAFGGEKPPLSHSYDHPFWAETINPVFSRRSVLRKTHI